MGSFYPLNDLFEELFDFLFSEIIVLYIVVKFTPLCHFHNDENISSCVEYFIKLDNVGMINEFKYLNLALDLGSLVIPWRSCFYSSSSTCLLSSLPLSPPSASAVPLHYQLHTLYSSEPTRSNSSSEEVVSQMNRFSLSHII